MLSFAEIGAAAMLSRATAGSIGTTAVFSLPGSEHAVRLAMTRLILPEIGHVVRELSVAEPDANDDDRPPIRETIPLDEARALVFDAAVPIERDRAYFDPRGRRPRLAHAAVVDGRRAAVRSGGDGRLRGDRRGHVRRQLVRAEDAALRRNGVHRPGRAGARVARHVHRDRDRRPAPRGRGCGRDGRGDRESWRSARSACSRRSIRGSTSGAAAPTSRPDRRCFSPGDLLNPEPRSARSQPWASSTSRSSPGPASRFSRPATRSSNPGQPLGPGQLYDINQFTLASIIGAHGGVAVVYPTVADTLPALTAAVAAARRRRHPRLLWRKLRRRARSHHRRDRPDGRGHLSRHRRQARASRRRSGASIDGRSSACQATRRRACRTPTCFSSRCSAASRGCPSTSRAPFACRSPAASSRRRAAISSTRCGSRTARRVPAFKASGDITSMAQADGYIEIPAQTDIVEAGEMVDVKLF